MNRVCYDMTPKPYGTTELDEFNIVIDDKVIKPVAGFGDEIAAFINERGRIKLRVILTGLKSILSEDEWRTLKSEFEI